MPKDDHVLRTGTEPKQVVATAIDFAASEQAHDQATLLEFLNSTDFLHRLNTRRDYDTSRPKQLRVAKIMKVLRDSPYLVSKQTLIGLARGGDFVDDNWLRQELLVRALVTIRPSPPEAIQFWDKQSSPDSVNRHIVIDMLCENGSEPAMDLLERKLRDQEQEIEYRVAWIHDGVLRHRNDLPLLRVCERMIRQRMPEDLHLVLLETLCSYDEDWYHTCTRPTPPVRLLASDESKQVLRRICVYARTQLDLSPKMKAMVNATLLEVGEEENPQPVT